MKSEAMPGKPPNTAHPKPGIKLKKSAAMPGKPQKKQPETPKKKLKIPTMKFIITIVRLTKSRTIAQQKTEDVVFRFFSQLILLLNIKQKGHNIAVLNNIFLAFRTDFPGFLTSLFTAQTNIIIIRNRFGTNKPTFKIRVNNAGALRRL